MKKLFLLLFFITMPIYSKKFIIMGHRGASAYEPENTLRSFKRAIEMGVDMIELDVYLSKSGEIVVMHDDTVNRTTNGIGKVKNLSFDQLKNLNAGKGEHIPLLSQVFDLVNKNNSKIIINIEIKDPDATKPISKLIQEYIQNKNLSSSNFIVSSFIHSVIKKLKKYCPNIKTGVIFEKNVKNPVNIAQKIGANFVIIDYRSATSEIVKKAHDLGMQVFAYTVNSKPEAQKLIKLNLDGIATNYPDILS